MRKIVLAALVIAFFAGCSEGNKFSAMRPSYGGQVDFASWPRLPRGVAGYNLYLAPQISGPWDKINDIPITGGHILVPYLQPGTEYYFRLTSVTPRGLESGPGPVFKRKAVASKPSA